ncbi:MAG: hypothetical protein NDI77_13425 [Geobacteraceae bacterium]|nr:hypothetical protein [Geobacteraceae bacterium]
MTTKNAAHPLRKYACSICMALLLVSMSACGTMRAYEGAELPQTQVAIIKGTEWLAYHVKPMLIDGNPTYLMKNKVVVLPGRHVVTVDYYWTAGMGFVTATGSVEFTAEAGHEYQIKAKSKLGFSGRKVQFWIEDIATGAVVGGQRPDDAESTQPKGE